MKTIILCADDYGQNEPISQAILELLGKRRLSATSCLTTFPCWSSIGKSLLAFKNQADLGLHINLTEGDPLSSDLKQSHGFLPLPKLLRRAYLGLLDVEAIRVEINAQLDEFIETMGSLPNFIDGHQHIHQFPIIREILLQIHQQRLSDSQCYIRNIYTKGFVKPAMFKNTLINLLGAKSLKKKLLTNKILHNTSFRGIYDFNKSASYRDYFPQFLAQSEHKGLIMCHPGLLGGLDDQIYRSRQQEFQYFSSDQFIEDCTRHRVILGRLA